MGRKVELKLILDLPADSASVSVSEDGEICVYDVRQVLMYEGDGMFFPLGYGVPSGRNKHTYHNLNFKVMNWLETYQEFEPRLKRIDIYHKAVDLIMEAQDRGITIEMNRIDDVLSAYIFAASELTDDEKIVSCSIEEGDFSNDKRHYVEVCTGIYLCVDKVHSE